jgi:aspartyl-tRNA(Asn)/glutamyl-tRNA(Gln) amidotransferase subunit B
MAHSLPFSYIIGLEIHVELTTNTKMFCRCKNDPFFASPNTNICPVCLGLPGTLPVPNKEAVRKTVLVGKALGSTIARLSKWDRKHYFYPDSPKGYQISQYDKPLCDGGELALLDAAGNPQSVIRFERVHLEEDAGKLQHTGQAGYSKVDLNRAGVPLMEMVTKPDLTSPEQARKFMQELRLLVRSLGVSEADMEKGQMRCDVNVNISFESEGKTVRTPITEVKNVNSTRAVERSLVAEAQRQFDEWQAGGPIRERVNKLTAGWDEDAGTVRINRTKEAANDYRYFPEPDLPPIAVYEVPELDPDSMVVPELPNARRVRYLALGIAPADVEHIMGSDELSAALETFLGDLMEAKEVAKWLINVPGSSLLSPVHLSEALAVVARGEVSFSALKPLVPELARKMGSGTSLQAFLSEHHLVQEHDGSVVQLAVDAVFAENPGAVQEYKDGNQRVLGFLVGQVMKKAAGKAQPQKVQEAVKEALIT